MKKITLLFAAILVFSTVSLFAQSRSEKKVQTHNQKGLLLSEQGNYDAAIKEFTEAIKLDPNEAVLYYNRGAVYEDKGDYDRAIADFTQAIRLDPKDGYAYLRRGAIYDIIKKEYDRAIADYTEAIKVGLGQRDEMYRAETLLRDAYINRGNEFINKNDYDRAIADFTQAIKLNPNNAIAYYNRGVAYRNKGDWDRAIADNTQAIKLNPNNPNNADAYNNRGIAYANKNDYDRAMDDFIQALRIDPNHTNAKNSLIIAQNARTQQQAQQQQAQPETKAQGNTFGDKLDWLKAFAQSGGKYVLEVNANLTGGYGFGYSGKSGITIILRGVGANRTITHDSYGTQIEIYSGVTLVLDNITLHGGSGNAPNNRPLVLVRGGGLIMNNGSAITGNINHEGVSIVESGTFTMNGGTISGNNGVGVYVSGTFSMSGGTISGNNGGNGGGVCVESGTFTMSGGTISGNTAGNGGGVCVESGTFTMVGGTISGNTARSSGGGVVIAWGIFIKTGGTITGYTGDTANGNVVGSRSNARNFNGHAVYARTQWMNRSNWVEVLKIRESTAGPEVNLSYIYNGQGNPPTVSGAWDN